MKAMEKRNYRDYCSGLLNLGPFANTLHLDDMIKYLKIPNCNLPVCSAVASFLYGRKDAPIADRFVAQFFTKEIHRNEISPDTLDVLDWIDPIPFRLEDGGAKDSYGNRIGRLRLAVFTAGGFNYNLKQYHQLATQCATIADSLNDNRYTYIDIEGNDREFVPVDVEMAIFSWATKNSSRFDGVR